MKRDATPVAGSPIWGGVLGAMLLAWSVMIVLAPELGSVIAVFGSPVLAWFIIVRLVSAGRGDDRSTTRPRGATLSEVRADPDLLGRVAARTGGVCAACGGAGQLHLRAVLPIGRCTASVEQRFAALCDSCDIQRAAGLRNTSQSRTRLIP